MPHWRCRRFGFHVPIHRRGDSEFVIGYAIGMPVDPAVLALLEKNCTPGRPRAWDPPPEEARPLMDGFIEVGNPQLPAQSRGHGWVQKARRGAAIRNVIPFSAGLRVLQRGAICHGCME